MTALTPEQFLAQPSTDPEDYDDYELQPCDVVIDTHGQFARDAGNPLESIADSMRTIAATMGQPVTDALAAEAHAEELRELGQAYDDLEAKHQSLYDLLADVEKIVAKSKSQVSLEVKAAITEWRNPTAEQVVEAPPQTSPTEPTEAPPMRCSTACAATSLGGSGPSGRTTAAAT